MRTAFLTAAALALSAAGAAAQSNSAASAPGSAFQLAAAAPSPTTPSLSRFSGGGAPAPAVARRASFELLEATAAECRAMRPEHLRRTSVLCVLGVAYAPEGVTGVLVAGQPAALEADAGGGVRFAAFVDASAPAPRFEVRMVPAAGREVVRRYVLSGSPDGGYALTAVPDRLLGAAAADVAPPLPFRFAAARPVAAPALAAYAGRSGGGRRFMTESEADAELAREPAPPAEPAPDYSRADAAAAAVTDEEAASVSTLAAALTRGLETDRDRARAIYRWITTRVAYDTDAFYGSRFLVPLQAPQDVLRRRTAVCDGFAGLFLELARAAGLQAAVVDGRAKALSTDPRRPYRLMHHAWNAVKVDGRWQAVDATWGAGEIAERRFVRNPRDFFFLAAPEKLVFSHAAADPEWQFVARPVSEGEFARQVFLPVDFWELGWRPEQVRRAAAEPGFAGAVESFPVPGHAVQVLDAPVSGVLRAGARVPIRIRAPGATEVVSASGREWRRLATSGDVHAGWARMAGDELLVMVRYPDRPEGAVVLRYTRGAPPAA